MSDAAAPRHDIYSIANCSQCSRPFPRSATSDARHAVPCGHVFCEDCLARVEAEQKFGTSFCRKSGCGKELSHPSEFAISWVPQRIERIDAKLKSVFGDQGNAGDQPVQIAGPQAAPSLCAEHKLPFQAVEASTHRPMCSGCLATAGTTTLGQTVDEAIALLMAEVLTVSETFAMQKSKLAEVTFTGDELRAKVSRWESDAMVQINGWEESEVKRVQAAALEIGQLVRDLAAYRIEAGASVLTQRMGLQASLEEFDQALADLPSDPAARLATLQTVSEERKRLYELLASNKIAIPWAWAVREWTELPSFSSELEGKSEDDKGPLAIGFCGRVKAALGRIRMSVPRMPSSEGVREFPVIPMLNKAEGLRLIPMGASPSVFIGLDGDTAVVGFSVKSPLQVWDLATGRLVRNFDGNGWYCRSLVKLSGGRVAAGWFTSGRHVVCVFDVKTGRQLQEITGFSHRIYGMAFVEDHLITMNYDKTLGVWSQNSAGEFTEKAKFATTGTPYGMLTVLSPSTVAVSVHIPAQIEIWDWRAGKCVMTLTGFGGGNAFGSSLLPDGRLIVIDSAGTIRVGSVDNWPAAVAISTDPPRAPLIGVLAGHDGSFVTTDEAGNIKRWRNGECETTLTGGYKIGGFFGVPVSVIGRRLVAVGANSTLLVAE